MKPVPAIIAPESIFYIRQISQPTFSSEFHFHEECQLAYIIKGSGKRIIGDSVEHFEENELVFIGSNLPHVWFTEKETGRKKPRLSVSLSLFISTQRFLDYLSKFGNISKVKKLFKKAQRGMLITGHAKTKLISMLKKAAAEKSSLEHITHLLHMVSILSDTREYELLARTDYTNTFQYQENIRMNNVYQFILQNFRKEISLSTIASIANMTPNAFCRFFKSRTQKSLTQFINEVRIGHACKLLTDRDESITQIAYECGYKNVSNFNRFFKMIKKSTPRDFRKELELT